MSTQEWRDVEKRVDESAKTRKRKVPTPPPPPRRRQRIEKEEEVGDERVPGTPQGS